MGCRGALTFNSGTTAALPPPAIRIAQKPAMSQSSSRWWREARMRSASYALLSAQNIFGIVRLTRCGQMLMSRQLELQSSASPCREFIPTAKLGAVTKTDKAIHTGQRQQVDGRNAHQNFLSVGWLPKSISAIYRNADGGSLLGIHVFTGMAPLCPFVPGSRFGRSKPSSYENNQK